MPDWFYRTVSRPVLFRLSARASRDLALGFMDALSRLPIGPAIIDFLGHMRASPRLGRSFLGIHFPTPVGLGPGLDADGIACSALARFGIGFLAPVFGGAVVMALGLLLSYPFLCGKDPAHEQAWKCRTFSGNVRGATAKVP